MDSALSILNTVLVPIGALAGLWVAGLTIYEHLTKRPPAILRIDAPQGQWPAMLLAPRVASNDAKVTEPFPLPITIRNKGRSTAKAVTLRLLFPPTLVIASSYKFEHMPLFDGPSERSMLLIQLPDLHPQSELPLASTIGVRCENIFDFSVEATSADNVPLRMTIGTVVTISITMSISAEDVDTHSATLYLTLGPFDELIKLRKPFWQVQENRLQLIVPTARWRERG